MHKMVWGLWPGYTGLWPGYTQRTGITLSYTPLNATLYTNHINLNILNWLQRSVTRVSTAIVKVLGPKHVKFPTSTEDFQQNILGFLSFADSKWFPGTSGIPQIIGAADGTHIPIKKPGGLVFVIAVARLMMKDGKIPACFTTPLIRLYGRCFHQPEGLLLNECPCYLWSHRSVHWCFCWMYGALSWYHCARGQPFLALFEIWSDWGPNEAIWECFTCGRAGSCCPSHDHCWCSLYMQPIFPSCF